MRARSLRSLLLALLFALAAIAPALAQPAADAPAAPNPPLRELRDELGNLDTSLARLGAEVNKTGTETARASLQDFQTSLSEAKRLLASVDTQAEQAALNRRSQADAFYIILAVTVGFVLISTIVIFVLSWNVRRSFFEKAATEPDVQWRQYLLNLPLGAPEGSVRALISIFVVVFGLLVLVMQRRLDLPSVDVIAGFIGIVITFYFTARTNDQANKAVGSAIDAAQKATAAAEANSTQAQAAISAATQVKADVADALDRHLSSTAAATAGQVKDAVAAALAQSRPDPAPVVAAPAPAPAEAPASDGVSRLRDIQGDLQLTRQIMGAMKGLGVGTQLFTGAESLAGSADTLLGTIDQALQSGGKGVDLAKIAGAGEQLLGSLGDVGVPGVLGGAMSVLGVALKLGGSALAGLPGGPVGVIAGLVTAGVQVFADQQKFDAWKSAVLAKPFDRSLLPASVDGNAALIALGMAPLMAKRLEGTAPNVATELLRACVTLDKDGNPRPIADIAQQLLTDMPDLATRFASPAELAEALEEYRTGAIFLQARDQLAGKIAIPALAGAPATQVDVGTLLSGVFQLHQDPRVAGALEKVVYLVQALKELHLDPGRLASVVQFGLETGAAMIGTSRSTEDPRA